MDPDHVMASGSTHPRPRAPCSEPSLPRRSSTEDADSNMTRKRPRLDLGDRGIRAMSADRVLTAPDFDSHDQPQPQPDIQYLGSEDDMSKSPRSTSQPTSSVTINVRPRDPSTNISEQNIATMNPDAPSNGNPPEAQKHETTLLQKNKKADSPFEDTLSPTVELVESESVEEAEVEEINLDTDIEVEPIIDVHAYIEEFKHRDYPATEVVSHLANLFEKGKFNECLTDSLGSQCAEDKVNPYFCNLISTWLNGQIEPFENREQDWDVLYHGQNQLWDLIGTLMWKILNRRQVTLTHTHLT